MTFKKNKGTLVAEHSTLRGRIFLDYASITPVAKEVLKTMKPFEEKLFANPSALYSEAIVAKEAVNKARTDIARILNCQKDQIIFTSGGTEGNNLALLGIFNRISRTVLDTTKHGSSVGRPHIITTAIEHSSILEVCKEIERCGGEITYLPVSKDGVVNPKDVREALRENTVLVSVMYANNEIGTIQPIREIARIVKDWRGKHVPRHALGIMGLPYFHTDACQAGLYLPLDVSKLGVDLLTLDGIKIYGPRGIGILYIKDNVEIDPIHFGGGQEKRVRSGTENVPAIVGLAKAMEISEKLKEKESRRLTVIRDYAISKILKTFPSATLNGLRENCLPNNINVCFSGLDAEFAVISLDVLGISASYSSSCRTLAEDSSSYVVNALGKENCSSSSLRFTLGRESTKSDIDQLILALKKIIKK